MKYFSQNIGGNFHVVAEWCNEFLKEEDKVIAVNPVNGHMSVIIYTAPEKRGIVNESN